MSSSMPRHTAVPMQDAGLSHLTQPSSPRSALHAAASAAAIWQESSSPEPPQRSFSPTRLGAPSRDCQADRAGSPRTTTTRHSWKSQQQSPSRARQLVTGEDQEEQQGSPTFLSGVRHAGWLWRRFGHGHKATWKKLWVYLCDDRLCYHQPNSDTASADAGSPRAAACSSAGPAAAAAAAAMAPASLEGSSNLPLVGYYGTMGPAGTMGSTAASLAALAAGEVRYIALDRIPVRPLPHRQHELQPMERSHPDVGVTVVEDGVVGARPTHIPANATFCLVAGSHTHYFAAESQREAELWTTVIREAWLHCFRHTARSTGGSAGTMTVAAAGVAVSQKLMAENALLRDSIQELQGRVTQANGEYWRKWVEEKAKNTVLESKMVNTAAYEVVVRTGGAKGTATDARVYLELYGPDAPGPSAGNRPSSPVTAAAVCAGSGSGSGSPSLSGCLISTSDASGEIRLFDADSTVKPFQRGATDSFTVACYNVGMPVRLKVWHDNTGRYPDWFLVDIKVRKQGTRDWVSFPCNRWLSTQYEDGSISRALLAGSSRPPVTYKLLVTTSDQRGAGTDANVYLQLHGLLGDGLQHQLLGSATAFDRGSKDEFFIDDADLGELTAVTISHDDSGTSPAWYLDHIQVIPVSNSRPNSPAAYSTNSNNSPQWPAEGGGQQYPGRRVSASSPQCSMRVSLGAVQQQLQKSGSSRGGSPAPFSQSRAGVNGAAYLFPCGAWLDETLGGGLTKRRLPVASCLDAKALHTVYISTSDIRGAGTDADVHIALSGSRGSSGTITLPSQPQQYQRGQRDKFRLQLPPMGQLQKLLIGHNNLGQAPSWHLSMVEVLDEDAGHTTYFAGDRWLGKQCGDGLSEITLSASSTDPRQAQCEYQVCFLTSPCRGAGTDSCVSFELRGSKGSSGPIIVSAGHEAFQRGGSDTFTYKRPHLGQLQQLLVCHDNSGAAAADGRGPWCLEAVVVSCKADQQVVTFPYGGWLSAETKLKVELVPGQAKGQTRYHFDVVTSDLRGAGTDAAVTLELCGPGPGACAGRWVLDRPGAFGRGQTDSFTVEGADLSSIASLKVALQVTQKSPSWHLEHVVCTVLEGKEGTPGRKYYFAADRWFGAGSASSSAVLAASSQLPPKQRADLQPYTVRVFTSHLRGAGTDANVSINAIGVTGSSGWLELPARQSAFEQGQEDVFTVLLPNVGRLTHLGLRSDGSGKQPTWHLANVCLQPQAQQGQQQGTGLPVWFSAHRWFDGTRGLEILLPAQEEDPDQNLQLYTVQVYTSDIKNAGTDCRIFLQLTGEVCAGPPAELQDQLSSAAAPLSPFRRGSMDTFRLQLPALGPLKTAAVWLEGHASPWHLDLILVTGPQGDQTFFVCGSWLCSGAYILPGAACAVQPRLATALNPVELAASSTDPRKARKEYKVVTFTSDIRGASTDAGVYIELFDAAGGSSGCKQLLTAAPDAFERGKADEFTITCHALGRLTKLRIGHDSKGARPAWHVAKVEVTDIAAGKTWYFAGKFWLDAAQGDGLTERLLTASDKDPHADMVTYKVTIVTCSHPAQSTNAALFVTLYGSKGPPLTSTPASKQPDASPAAAPGSGMSCSGRCELEGSGSAQSVVALEPGASSSFVLPAMHSLGQLRQLLLEVDTSGKQAVAWRCQHVEVTDTSSGETWLFPCNAWLGSSTGTAAGAAAPLQQCESSKLLLPSSSLNGLLRQLHEEQELEKREQYKVAVYTSSHSPAQGHVGALVLTVTAASGAALGPVRLSKAPQPCFGAGSCDVFEVAAVNKLGALQHAKVVCELPGAGACWHLATISVTAQSTGETTWFYAGRWFDGTSGFEALLQSSLQDKREQLFQYQITTHTSDIEGAATSAHVLMALSGTAGSSGALELSHPNPMPASSNGFARGEAASFTFGCAGLGDLQQLVVWHDSSGAQPAWHLAYVEVAELSTGKVWYFPCNQWLDARRSDGVMQRTLQATTSFSPDSLLMRYRAGVKTGDVRGAATDSAVFLNICGTLGSTGPKRLNASAGSFNRGALCEVTVSGFDVGDMTHVIVSLDGSGLLSSWYLDELEVEHLGTGQLLRFKVARWLDHKRPGCSLQYELWPDTGKGQATSSPCLWELVLYTGRAPGAGTDADVSVELTGTSGTFGPQMLPASTDAFQEGCRDSFSLETPDLGDLLSLVISHNCKGRQPTWFLHGVELAHVSSGTRYSWRVGAWLNPQQGCSRTLRAAHAQKGALPLPEAAATGSAAAASSSYQLEVQTADIEGAGTTGSMFVQLGGVLGESEAVQLTANAGSVGGLATGQNAGALFQRGCLDVFVLKGMPDVGRLSHLIIGHDGSGLHPGWHLSWVRVINLTSGARALFTANQWLDSTRPGCQNWAKLLAGPDEAVPRLQSQQQQLSPGQLVPRGPPLFGVTELQQAPAAGGSRFKGWLHSKQQPGHNVTFVTSNIWGAGTGSKVFFELIGEHGTTGVVYPTGPHSQFSRGCKVSFLYPRLPYVGQLHQLRVGTDGSGLFAAWHLRQVEVTYVPTGQRWLFNCSEWLDRHNMWQLMLPAASG